jgi:hypothetical protein
MKRFFVASAFACVFSISTLAGEIPSDGAPKPQSQQTTVTADPGDIPTDGQLASVSDAALSALLTALGLALF